MTYWIVSLRTELYKDGYLPGQWDSLYQLPLSPASTGEFLNLAECKHSKFLNSWTIKNTMMSVSVIYTVNIFQYSMPTSSSEMVWRKTNINQSFFFSCIWPTTSMPRPSYKHLVFPSDISHQIARLEISSKKYIKVSIIHIVTQNLGTYRYYNWIFQHPFPCASSLKHSKCWKSKGANYLLQ